MRTASDACLTEVADFKVFITPVYPCSSFHRNSNCVVKLAIDSRFFEDNKYYETLKTRVIEKILSNEESDQLDLFRLVKSFVNLLC